MRGITHRWTPRGTGADATDPGLSREPLLTRVLRARGLTDPAQAEAFCTPRLVALHDPSLLPGADRAAERLLSAARSEEPIAIYGDYDADGITATAILFHTLRALAPGCPLITYVPHRLDEGYGLNAEAIGALADHGARVIVSVDCGITAVEPALVAAGRGIDLIITDHHNYEGERSGDPCLPQCFAAVHPRLPGSAYPFVDLCGAGVAFKLAWRLATLAQGNARVSESLRETLLDALALASLGTIADIVPLLGENRLIAAHGLKRLPFCRIEGIHALIEASNLTGKSVDAEQVGFLLAPRLNACGRMGHAREAVELLTTARGEHAHAIAASLTALNEERKSTERRITDQAIALADKAGMTGDARRAIVLAHPDWHPGVVGICCSRLVARFHRPVILLQNTGELCQGSGRSISRFNLHEALAQCASHLERFGGHDMAAGLSLRADQLDAFAEAFTGIADDALTPDDLVPTLSYDCQVTLPELTPNGVRQLDRLGPFGRDNPAPALRISGARLVRQPEHFGAHARHLSFFLEQGGRTIRVVAWGWGEHARQFRSGDTIDAVIEPRISSWGGNTSVEPVLHDAARSRAPALTAP